MEKPVSPKNRLVKENGKEVIPQESPRILEKIKILLGLKKTICKDCRHCLRGIWCTKKGLAHTNYVTGEKTKEHPFCQDANTDGRCLGFEEAISQ